MQAKILNPIIFGFYGPYPVHPNKKNRFWHFLHTGLHIIFHYRLKWHGQGKIQLEAWSFIGRIFAEVIAVFLIVNHFTKQLCVRFMQWPRQMFQLAAVTPANSFFLKKASNLAMSSLLRNPPQAGKIYGIRHSVTAIELLQTEMR